MWIVRRMIVDQLSAGVGAAWEISRRSPAPVLPLRCLAGLLAALAMTACQTLPDDPGRAEISDERLLSGIVVFGETLSSAEVPEATILDSTEAMRTFVDPRIRTGGTSVTRAARLLRKLVENGYFERGYERHLTQTAADTFATKAGNCLSFTNLFVALARMARLEARYQVVDVPPSFDSDLGLLFRNTHINVLVPNADIRGAGRGDLTVDFNRVDTENYRRQLVSDTYAAGLFYNNLSVNHWRQGDNRKAFAYLAKALETYSGNPDLWVNLGAFYSKHGAYEHALAAHYRALRLDGRSRPAMAGLAAAYAGLGDMELSDAFTRRVEHYRRRNPYYHYALAQVAYQDEDFAGTLVSLDLALALKRDDHRFHYLKSLAQWQLGERMEARASLVRAERFANQQHTKRRYARMADAIAANEVPESLAGAPRSGS